MKPPDRLSEDPKSKVGALLARVPAPRPSPGAGPRAWRAFEARRVPSRGAAARWFALGAAMATAVTLLVVRVEPRGAAEDTAAPVTARVLEQWVPGRLEVRSEREPVEVRTPAEVIIVHHAVAAIEVGATGDVVVRVLQGAVYLRRRDAWLSAGSVETLTGPPPVREAGEPPVAPSMSPVATPSTASAPRPPRPPSPPAAAPVAPGPVVEPPREPAPPPTEQARLRAALALRQSDPPAAAEQLRALVASPSLGEAAAYELGRLQAGALRDPASAVTTFREAQARFPRGVLRSELAVSLVEALLAAGQPAEALGQLDAVGTTAIGRERRDELETLRGDILRALGRAEDAVQVLEPVASGASPFAERALVLLADCHARLGHGDAARATLRTYLERFPQGRHAAEARRALGP